MSGGACESDHCITCSDEGVPMRIVEASSDGLALCVDGDGSESTVMTDLVGFVGPGDSVLVHAGVALARLDAEAFA
jgi:hydrogenase expression/formation protein HypC